MGRRFAASAAACLTALCILMLLLTGLLHASVLPASLEGMMTAYAPPESTLLPESEYPGMADMLSRYLLGQAEEMQYSFRQADGSTALCFHDYEQAHMADCRGLFILCRTCGLTAAALLPLMLLILFLTKDCRKAAAAGMLCGFGLPLLMIAAAALWGMVDFDSLFVLFHRIAFTNDLWLLNPATDLLIRLMPIGFFIHAAVRIAVPLLLCMIVGTALSLLRLCRKPR